MDFKELKGEKYINKTIEFLNKRYRMKLHQLPTGQYISCCPIHLEVEPSFISLVKNGEFLFHCFGCNSDYDIFNIIQRRDGVDFRRAIKIFADFLKVETKNPSKKNKNGHDIPINSIESNTQPIQAPEVLPYHEEKGFATNVYKDILRGSLAEGDIGKYNDVYKYLLKRGAGVELIKILDVGYSPTFKDEAEGRALVSAYLQDNANIRPLMNAGLVEMLCDDSKPFLRKYAHGGFDNNSRFYCDCLTDRIIFPVKDIDGKVVALCGRRRKPRNTRDRYRLNAGAMKRQVLFGIDIAAPNIKKYKTVIICEGIFDAIRLINACGGPQNSIVVATMGASFSAEQAAILEGLGVENYLFAYDADAAGYAGLRKAVNIVKGNVYKLVVWRKDPAEYFAHGIPFLQNLKGLKDDLDKIAFNNKNRPASWIEAGRQYSLDILSGNTQFIIASASGSELYQHGKVIPTQEKAAAFEVKAVKTKESSFYYYSKENMMSLIKGGKTNLAGKAKRDQDLEDFLKNPGPDSEDTFRIYADFIKKGIYEVVWAEIRVFLFLWMTQQENGYITLADSDIADKLSMDRSTFNILKKSLEAKGFLSNQEVKKVFGKKQPQNKYSVKCFPKTVKPLLLVVSQPAMETLDTDFDEERLSLSL